MYLGYVIAENFSEEIIEFNLRDSFEDIEILQEMYNFLHEKNTIRFSRSASSSLVKNVDYDNFRNSRLSILLAEKMYENYEGFEDCIK